MTNPTNTLAWFEVATDDPDTATAFYTDLFGWTFTPFADPEEAGVDYRVATQPEGGPPFGGVLATGGAMAPHAIFSIAVADVGRDVPGHREAGWHRRARGPLAQGRPAQRLPARPARQPVQRVRAAAGLTEGRLALVTDDASPARKLYEDLTDDLLYDPSVGRSTMMGHPCVRRAGRFFASFDPKGDRLVVKLPAEQVEALIDKGTGEPFAPNGKVFREWVAIPTPDPSGWARLLAEAFDFAGPAQQQARRRYDEDLADRIRELLEDLGVGVREQKMFGGLAFLVNGHMAVAASGEGGVLVGVDPDESAKLLRKPHTRPMVMRGREMSGWIRVSEDGVRTKRQLTPWVRRGVDHARSKPPKRAR